MNKLHRQGKMTGFPRKKDGVEPYSRTHVSDKDQDTLDARKQVKSAKKVMSKEQSVQSEQRKKENPHLPDLEDTAKRRLSPAKKVDWRIYGYGGEAIVRHPKVGKKERVIGVDVDNPHFARTVSGEEKDSRTSAHGAGAEKYIAKKSMSLDEAVSILKSLELPPSAPDVGPAGDAKRDVLAKKKKVAQGRQRDVQDASFRSTTGGLALSKAQEVLKAYVPHGTRSIRGSVSGDIYHASEKEVKDAGDRQDRIKELKEQHVKFKKMRYPGGDPENGPAEPVKS
jgi:hypothetical protein